MRAETSFLTEEHREQLLNELNRLARPNDPDQQAAAVEMLAALDTNDKPRFLKAYNQLQRIGDGVRVFEGQFPKERGGTATPPTNPAPPPVENHFEPLKRRLADPDSANSENSSDSASGANGAAHGG